MESQQESFEKALKNRDEAVSNGDYPLACKWRDFAVSIMKHRTMSEMVTEFHEKQGIIDPHSLRESSGEWLLIMQEEWHEVVEALLQGNKERVAHELADLMYTVVGTALTFGIEIEPVFAEVHKANMTKGPGFDKSTYVPPEIEV